MNTQEEDTIKTFVRRMGRMSDLLKDAHNELASRYLLSLTPGTVVDPAEIYPDMPERILEIGSGMGHALVALAEARPQTGFIGIDVHRPGIARTMLECRSRNLENIRLIEHDALDVCRGYLAEASLDGIHVFFPDPWPKKRHHKRRLIQQSHLPQLLRVLKPGGYLYCVTDWAEYGDWMLEETARCPALENPSGGFSPPISWRPRTRFEQKGLDKGHPIRELYLIKTEPKGV